MVPSPLLPNANMRRDAVPVCGTRHDTHASRQRSLIASLCAPAVTSVVKQARLRNAILEPAILAGSPHAP